METKLSNWRHGRNLALLSNTKEEIVNAGEKIFASLYGLKDSSLHDARYKIYQKLLHKKSNIQKDMDIRMLPPTVSAAKYHSLRVYHQVREWLGNSLDPLNYGWETCDNRLVPKRTDADIAPKNILSKITCSCKTSCNKRCSCRKINMSCTDSCKCSEEKCENRSGDKEDEFVNIGC